ncbi:MAG: flavoprotein [Myxococcota bacterium]
MARILLGVTGGIAAFKAVLVLRELMQRGHEVKVVLTEAAQHFVGPITFGALTGDAPVTNLWDARYNGEIHVELADWAEAMVIVPATANTMAKVVHGLADDALLATWLCFDQVRVMAPAMHHRMWAQASTQRNVAQLLADGVILAGPVVGRLANGAEGNGRMLEPVEIVDVVEACLNPTPAVRPPAGEVWPS